MRDRPDAGPEGRLSLRETNEADLPTLFEHQCDPVAVQMAALTPRALGEFMAHWKKILADPAIDKRTILVDGDVAGYILAFEQSGKTMIGYWVGREFWGQGVASRSLSVFLSHVTERPLHAVVAKHNPASVRVLRKCGFEVLGPIRAASESRGPAVEEIELKLSAKNEGQRFEPRTESLGAGGVCVRFDATGRQLRYGDVLDLWEGDEVFRSTFISVLAGIEYPAFRWETPPVVAGNAGRPFEFVMLDAPWLDIPAEATAFAGYFEDPETGDGVVTFPNLGGDALLVVPEPRGPAMLYSHLAAFSRHAPKEQNDALWRAVARAMKQRLGQRPVWLSTAGGGVPWLHVRLDDRPKYYGHRPYAMEPVD